MVSRSDLTARIMESAEYKMTITSQKSTEDEKYHVIPIIFWIGFSLLVMALSYNLGLEGFHDPGPGFTPFVASLLLLVVSSYLLISLLLRKTDGVENIQVGKKKPNLGRVSFVVLALFGYSLLLEKLGFLVTTSILLILLFRSVGIKWSFVLITSLMTVLIIYFVFSYLGVTFPAGIFDLLRLKG